MNGIRMIHYPCFRSMKWKKLSLSSLPTIHVHVRLSTSKSKTLELLHNHPVQESRKLKNVAFSEVKKLKQGDPFQWDNFARLLKDLDLAEGVTSSSLSILEKIKRQENVSPAKLAKLAEDLFQVFRSSKVAKTEEHYIRFFEFCATYKCFPNVNKILSELAEDGAVLSEALQRSISKCFSGIDKSKELKEMVKMLNQLGIEVSESIYEEIIYSLAISGDVNEAIREYNELVSSKKLKQRNLEISLLRGLIHNGNETMVKDKLAELVATDHKFSYYEVTLIIEEILVNKHLYLIPHVVQALGESAIVQYLPDLLKKLVQENKVESAFDLLQYTYNSGTEHRITIPTSIYKGLIDELNAVNHPTDDLLQKCEELRKCENCQYVLEYLLYTCLKEEKFSDALEVLYRLGELGAPVEQHYFWPLLVQAHKRFNVEGVCHIVETMFLLGSYPDKPTLLKYVYPYLNSKIYFKYLKLLSSSGRIFEYLEQVLLVYGLENGHYSECAKLVRRRPVNREISYHFLEKPFMTAFEKGDFNSDLMAVLKWTNGVDPWEVLLKFWRDGEEDKMQLFLEQCIAARVIPTKRQSAKLLFNMPNLPPHIKTEVKKLMAMMKPSELHPDFEFVKESMYECEEIIQKLEIHMAELKAKMMSPIGQIFRLLKYYMKFGLYSRALKMREELFKIAGKELDVSPAYLSCLCRLSEYEGDFDEALCYYRRLRKEYKGFLLDVPKAIGLCKLFIKTGSLDEFMDLIERVPKWRGNLMLIEHKMLSLLRDVAELRDPEKTRIIFEMLVKKDMILPTKNTLQVFPLTYQAMGEFEQAMREFKRVTQEFGTVPSPSRLCWDLIQRRDFQNFDEILDIVSRHEHNKAIIVPMLRLLACLGDKDVLRKYFVAHGIELNDLRIRYYIGWEHFGGSPDIRMTAFKTFLSLAEYSKPAVHFYASAAVEHVCFDKSRKHAEELCHLLDKMSVLRSYQRKLNNLIELTKIVEKTAGRVVPFAIMKNEETLWREPDF